MSQLVSLVDQVVIGEESFLSPITDLRKEELALRVEEAICRYDGWILIGGEPKDAAEWAVREVSVWLSPSESREKGQSIINCVEEMVAKARNSPNSIDLLLREMVGRFVVRGTVGL